MSPPSERPRLELRRIWVVGRIAVTGALLVAIVSQLGGIPQLGHALIALSPWAIAGALAALTVDRLLMTAKWLLLLPPHGGRLGLLAGTRIYCSSLLYGLFLPATLGADALRVALSARRGLRPESVLVSVLVERMIGGVALLLLNLAAVAILQARHELSPELRALSRLTAVALALGLVLIAAALVRPNLGDALAPDADRRTRRWPLLRKLHALHDAWHRQLVPGRRLWAFFALTLVEQLLPVLPIWIILRDQGAAPDLPFIAAAMAVAHLAARLPLSIGGVGVQEASLALMLVQGGVPQTAALLTALAVRVLETLCCVPWWLAQMLDAGAAAPQRSPTTPGRASPRAALNPPPDPRRAAARAPAPASKKPGARM